MQEQRNQERRGKRGAEDGEHLVGTGEAQGGVEGLGALVVPRVEEIHAVLVRLGGLGELEGKEGLQWSDVEWSGVEWSGMHLVGEVGVEAGEHQVLELGARRLLLVHLQENHLREV